MSLTDDKALELSGIARELRINLLSMIHHAKSGHPGGSLSAADIMTVLYFHEMRVDPIRPRFENRDRFVLSKGHVCPVLYTALAMRGFFPIEELSTLRQFGSRLQGHPDMNKTPGVDMSTGSLGQGISCAVGMAVAGKRDGSDFNVYVLLGDGECNEGQVWEAAQTAVKYRLDNLFVIVDNNKLQNDGSCEEIMPSGDLSEKFSAFGFETKKIDGHNIREITQALDALKQRKGSPKCIIADTVKGKGVSFMEGDVYWHGVAPDSEQLDRAIREIREG